MFKRSAVSEIVSLDRSSLLVALASLHALDRRPFDPVAFDRAFPGPFDPDRLESALGSLGYLTTPRPPSRKASRITAPALVVLAGMPAPETADGPAGPQAAPQLALLTPVDRTFATLVLAPPRGPMNRRRCRPLSSPSRASPGSSPSR